MVACLFCPVCQIVWIDANAVPTNKAWIKLLEILFGRGGNPVSMPSRSNTAQKARS
jgi:hypothetical protein